MSATHGLGIYINTTGENSAKGIVYINNPYRPHNQSEIKTNQFAVVLTDIALVASLILK